jgi:mono/diheme cytochrome c family protein
MKRCVLLFAILIAAVASTPGCGTARRDEPIAGPLGIQDPQIALGQRVYMTSCHQCHPGGTAGLGPAINNKPLPGFMIKMQTRAGLGAMPGFSSSELSDEELDAVVAYLKALRKHG